MRYIVPNSNIYVPNALAIIYYGPQFHILDKERKQPLCVKPSRQADKLLEIE